MSIRYLKYISYMVMGSIFFTDPALARSCNLPHAWHNLCPVLQSRVHQQLLKMKLQEQDAKDLEDFLADTEEDFPSLISLQILLPKTTVELLISIIKRGVPLSEAELMASYLQELVSRYHFQNVAAFDNNTSHIIGRQWHEIDYSGEGMTWQKQKAFYAPYGIEHFKSLACLKKFFAVESKLPYFKKIYKPHQGG